MQPTSGFSSEAAVHEFVRHVTTRKTPAVRIVVRHSPAGNTKGADVETIECCPTEGTYYPVDEIVREIVSAIERDAMAVGGVQRYLLLPLATGSDRPISRLQVNYKGSEDYDDSEEGQDSEPPTERGVLRMTMRHQEVFVRSQAYGSQSTIAVLERQISRMEKSLNDAKAENDRLSIENRRLQTEDRALRALELEAESKAKQRGEVSQSLRMLLPHFAARFMGQPGVAAAGATTAALREFVGSLSEAQIARIASNLTEAQQIALFGALSDFAPPPKEDAAHGNTNGATGTEKPATA